MPSGMASGIADHQPEDVDDRPHGRRGEATPALGDADPPAGKAFEMHHGESLAQVARHRGGRQDGGPVAVEGQRGDHADAVELHGRPQGHPGRDDGAVDLGP